MATAIDIATAHVIADEHGISWTVDTNSQTVTAAWRDAHGAPQYKTAAFVLNGANDKVAIDAAIAEAVMAALGEIVKGSA